MITEGAADMLTRVPAGGWIAARREIASAKVYASRDVGAGY
jgi:hypothetical protein